jgi:hypothetical protein
MAGTTTDISLKTTNEIIVYNTPHMSNIGIRTGKVLNLFSDSSNIVPEVKRHCATLGLRIRTVVLKDDYHCINAGSRRILISSYLNKRIIQNFDPDILILTGSRPKIENDLDLRHPPGLIIIFPETSPGVHLPQQMVVSGKDNIYFIKKSGAFVKGI